MGRASRLPSAQSRYNSNWPTGSSSTMVVLGTAHAAKFPDAIEKAIGLRPPLPHHMAGLFDRPERFTVLPNDTPAVETFIRDRVGRGPTVKIA